MHREDANPQCMTVGGLAASVAFALAKMIGERAASRGSMFCSRTLPHFPRMIRTGS
jgi:hypothetical protein